ncbi:TPA: hypothetical protein QB352_002299 [Pasteurella multocida]|nr:hypothetical protein [Pasteurella multocida]
MAEIKINYMTPRHFYESLKLLKYTDNKIMLGFDSVEIRFHFDREESFIEAQERLERMEHLKMFLIELSQNSVPMDINEFVKIYTDFKFKR